MTATVRPHAHNGAGAWWLHNLSAGDGDRWGNAMAHAFGIATALYVAEEPIPTEWEFAPGASLGSMTLEGLADEDWPDCEYAEMLLSGEATADELRYVGSVLVRYTRLLNRAGLSY